eukprot:5690419-Amphidinium_carterae.1
MAQALAGAQLSTNALCGCGHHIAVRADSHSNGLLGCVASKKLVWAIWHLGLSARAGCTRPGTMEKPGNLQRQTLEGMGNLYPKLADVLNGIY